MAENLGTGVSYVYEPSGYNYDTVVFQKGKPPMDSEVNLLQDLQRVANRRQLVNLASGWLTMRKFKTDPLLSNAFWTQDPNGAVPEHAIVDGIIVEVAGTAKTLDLYQPGTNLIDLGAPPATGNRVCGVFLEVWRALLDPDTSANKPDPVTIVDSIRDLAAVDSSFAFAVGDNGLVLSTQNGGSTWNVQLSGTRYRLNGVDFVTRTIGWAVGENGTLLRTSSGGERWSALTSGITYALNGVSAVSQLQAWAVGAAGTVLKTINGVTFIPQSSGTTADLRGVHFHDNLVGWVVGAGGAILKTTDGGTTWHVMTSGTSATLNAVVFFDLQTGFAVGNGGVLLRTSDGGSTWVSQSGNVWDSVSYSTVTADLLDIAMSPSLDDFVDGEEISSQFNGTNKNCSVSYVPVTRGDGLGTTTNNPADISVTVDGVVVGVDSLNGATGQIILSEAPRTCTTVKVSYWHKVASGVFRGKVWTVGRVAGSPAKATVLATDNLGVQWAAQDPQTAYDLNAVAFADRSIGWTVGDNSIIRATLDGGSHWTVQQSEAIARVTQRIFDEGNTGSPVYLEDNSIHPDANVQTTKRVQVQYKIRVINDADPASFPEAGLGASSVVALGPNTTGSYSYINQGVAKGDYGLWQAQCPNTVDGMAWAVPMFFVSRRNTTAYDPLSNANGQTMFSTGAIRPDLLTAIQVADGDILDVRRMSVVPAAASLLEGTFDDMSSGSLRTRFARDSKGGDKYGTELPQLDKIGVAAGGDPISSTLTDVVNGISSEVTLSIFVQTLTAGTSVPAPQTLSATGTFDLDPSYFSATYVSTNATYNGKPVPGSVSGLGTTSVVFTFSPYALTQGVDAGLASYLFKGRVIEPPSASLSYVPASPGLARNVSGSTSTSFYYFGVSEGTSRVVEQWDSGIPNYPNEVVAYACSDSDSGQVSRASSVELHYFTRITSTQIVSESNNLKAKFPKEYVPTSGGVPYQTHVISKINNIDAGFSYKMANQTNDGVEITVEALAGFPFNVGATVEVVAYVLSSFGSANIRNGATVNFMADRKGIGLFCASSDASGSVLSAPSVNASVQITDGEIKGVSTAETALGLTQPVCWWFNGVEYTMVQCNVTSGMDSSSLTLTFADGSSRAAGPVIMQAMYRQTALQYDSSATDGLQIGYSRVPCQATPDLPSSLTVEFSADAGTVYVSDMGTGGGSAGYPYGTPLENIPVNDPSIANDDVFHNSDPLRFNTFSVDGGFVKVPALVPARTGGTVTFTNPSVDRLGRAFYSTCSRTMPVQAEGLTVPAARKVYSAFAARVVSAADARVLPGETLMVVMSRNESGTENTAGWETASKCAVAVYRMKNKPITRV